LFLTVKKRIIVLSLVCVLAVGLVVGVVALPAEETVGRGKTVVIDAGHGGEDGGVVGSSTGIKESDVNLAVAKKLRDVLVEGGYNVVMTRTTDTALHGSALGSKKLADMRKRKEIILEAQPDLVVSIHQNYYPSDYVKGVQVFYAPNGKSYDEAAVMQKILNRQLGGSRVEAKGDYYIVQCTPYPSVLVECGFLSNPEEEALLVTSEYQQRVAYALYSGINFILGSPIIA